jgi:hypothetical protein
MEAIGDAGEDSIFGGDGSDEKWGPEMIGQMNLLEERGMILFTFVSLFSNNRVRLTEPG